VSTRVLCAILLLACLSGTSLAKGATAAPSRCILNEPQVFDYYSQYLKDLRSHKLSFPTGINYLSQNWNLETNFQKEGRKLWSRDIVIEGFYRPEVESFIRIPYGLGYGLRLKRNNIIHFCIDMTHPVEKSQISLIVMSGQGLDEGRFFDFGQPKIKEAAVTLMLSPVNIIENIPVINILPIPEIVDDTQLDVVLGLFNDVFGEFIKKGVQKIVLRPASIEITAEVGLLRSLEVKKLILKDSYWLFGENDKFLGP
jgi:hypothetical protein